jgi:hypothetical protein
MGRTHNHGSLHTQCYPDVLDTVVAKDFVLTVYLIVCSALSSEHLPVLINITCQSFFQNLLDQPDLTQIDWAAFQVCLDHRLTGNHVVNDEEAIDKCVELLNRAIHAPKRRPRTEMRPPLPDSVQDETRLKNRLRSL